MVRIVVCLCLCIVLLLLLQMRLLLLYVLRVLTVSSGVCCRHPWRPWRLVVVLRLKCPVSATRRLPSFPSSLGPNVALSIQPR